MRRFTSLALCFIIVISLLLSVAPVKANAATVWENKCEYVKTNTNLNVRKGPGSSYARKTTIATGHQVLRISSGSNGWSKVIVKGEVGYMSSEYLRATTYNPSLDVSATNIYSGVTFTRVNETVQAKQDVNVRKGPGTSYDVMGALKPSESVIRIGIGNNGWSQIIYKDKVAHVNTNYLSETSNKIPDNNIETPPVKEEAPTTPPSQGDVYEVTIGVNVRKGKSTSSLIIGLLPKGTRFTAIEKIGTWVQFNYNGQIAYVHASCVKKVSTPTTKPTPTPPIQEEAPTTPPSSGDVYKTRIGTNVRKAKSTSSQILGLLPKGTTFTAIEKTGYWVKFNYNGQIAYVHASCVNQVSSSIPTPPPQEETKPNTPPVEENENNVYYTTTGLNVRTGPSTSYRAIGTLPKGTKVVVIGKSGGWRKINYNGQTAYCHGDYLTQKTPQSNVNTSGYPMTYKDSTCTITVYKEWYENAYVYAAHVVYTDYDRLWVECARGKYNSGTETTSAAAKRVGAILAINGDYATPGNGASGYAIARNGKVCNNKKTYSEGVYNGNTGVLLYGQSKGIGGQMLSDLVAAGKVTDTFQFGPCVLLDGKVQGDKNSTSRAQRTFIGTNGKPGDIWLCVSDGRNNDGKSAGLNGYQCGAYLKSKGCTLGVPLDGGGSSTMYFNGKVLNAAKNGQRAVPDFVMFK